jgi:hypothetical protein
MKPTDHIAGKTGASHAVGLSYPGKGVEKPLPMCSDHAM